LLRRIKSTHLDARMHACMRVRLIEIMHGRRARYCIATTGVPHIWLIVLVIGVSARG
jgi:hypothetical protein